LRRVIGEKRGKTGSAKYFAKISKNPSGKSRKSSEKGWKE
jgi:hypothetical protein